MNNPLVSIIISTYNGNHNWLSESIDSVLNQSFTDFELIIINDCSTNDIEKTIFKYSEKDNRIVYIKNETNLGVAESRNIGIKKSKSKYIAILDDDDIWYDENKLKRQVIFMEQNPDYGVCGTNTILIDEKGLEISKIKMTENNLLIKNKLLISNQFTHSSIIFINKGFFYDEKFKFVEDYELILKIGSKYKLHNINEYLTKYRVKSKGVSSDNLKKINVLCIKLIYKYKNYYNNFYIAIIINIIKLLIPNIIYKKLLNIYLKLKNDNK